MNDCVNASFPKAGNRPAVSSVSEGLLLFVSMYVGKGYVGDPLRSRDSLHAHLMGQACTDLLEVLEIAPVWEHTTSQPEAKRSRGPGARAGCEPGGDWDSGRAPLFHHVKLKEGSCPGPVSSIAFRLQARCPLSGTSHYSSPTRCFPLNALISSRSSRFKGWEASQSCWKVAFICNSQASVLESAIDDTSCW